MSSFNQSISSHIIDITDQLRSKTLAKLHPEIEEAISEIGKLKVVIRTTQESNGQPHAEIITGSDLNKGKGVFSEIIINEMMDMIRRSEDKSRGTPADLPEPTVIPPSYAFTPKTALKAIAHLLEKPRPNITERILSVIDRTDMTDPPAPLSPEN